MENKIRFDYIKDPNKVTYIEYLKFQLDDKYLGSRYWRDIDLVDISVGVIYELEKNGYELIFTSSPRTEIDGKSYQVGDLEATIEIKDDNLQEFLIKETSRILMETFQTKKIIIYYILQNIINVDDNHILFRSRICEMNNGYTEEERRNKKIVIIDEGDIESIKFIFNEYLEQGKLIRSLMRGQMKHIDPNYKSKVDESEMNRLEKEMVDDILKKLE